MTGGMSLNRSSACITLEEFSLCGRMRNDETAAWHVCWAAVLLCQVLRVQCGWKISCKGGARCPQGGRLRVEFAIMKGNDLQGFAKIARE